MPRSLLLSDSLSGRAHTRCRPFRGSSFVDCLGLLDFSMLNFLRSLLRRGIEMIRADFELRKRRGRKEQRKEYKPCQMAEFTVHIINLTPGLNCSVSEFKSTEE